MGSLFWSVTHKSQVLGYLGDKILYSVTHNSAMAPRFLETFLHERHSFFIYFKYFK